MSATATVGDLVVERPSRARVFERFGIDYCCGGKLPLNVACEKRGVDIQHVLAVLEEEATAPVEVERNWTEASLADLTAHVETTHHAYLKRELPRLDYMTERVADRHGAQRPELRKLREIFMVFKGELEEHMAKEERVLFPMCRNLEKPDTAKSRHGSVKNPVAVMISEHEHAGEDLRQIRELTHDFVPPVEACNTYRAMLAGLEDLEADMHRHVHLENYVMFPKAIAAEAQRSAPPA